MAADAKHTPGPWRMEQSAHANPLFWVVADAPIHGTGVATCGSDSEGDAHLIAAAPDLLAACETLMGYIDNGTLVRDVERDGQPDFTIRMMHFVRDLGAAQAAIAKAKGAR